MANGSYLALPKQLASLVKFIVLLSQQSLSTEENSGMTPLRQFRLVQSRQQLAPRLARIHPRPSTLSPACGSQTNSGALSKHSRQDLSGRSEVREGCLLTCSSCSLADELSITDISARWVRPCEL